VRLPIPDDDLAFLDLPLADRVGRDPARQPIVELSARFAGAERTWQGRIVRTEGEIDPRSRMIHAVARVEKPYVATGGQPPLAVGLFVDASILGHRVDDVVVIPRSAVHDGDVVHVVDAEDRLRIRSIEVLRREQDRVVVRSGLASGERVAVSRLTIPIEGMPVRPLPVGAALDAPSRVTAVGAEAAQ
jgi:multidrug efflux system membrane fusion protein